ncbi:MAG: AI-2E family transporter [Cyclobacteriaceae bacterium]
MNSGSFSDSLAFRLMLATVILGMSIFFIIYFKDLLKPFVLAIMIWYLIKTIYNYIGRVKIMGKPLPRWLRGTLAIMFIVVCTQLTVDLVVSSLSDIVNNYAKYQRTLNTMLLDLGMTMGVENLTDSVMEQVSKLNLQGFLSTTLSSLSTMIGNLVIIIIYIVFLLLEEVAFSNKLDLILRDSKKSERVRRILEEIYDATNKYITLKTGVSLLTGGISYIILLIFGIDYAFLWAFLIFILNYIPYIGSLVATLLPSIFAIIQFGSLWSFLWVFISVEAVQIVVGNYIEPKVMGRSLNLSPLVVVLALSFWGYVWDLLGMFLSVPITSIMLITLAQFPATRNIAILLTENGNLENVVVGSEKDEPNVA